MTHQVRAACYNAGHSVSGLAFNSGGIRELSLQEIAAVDGGAIHWGSVYRSATAGLIGGAVGGAILGGLAGAGAGAIGGAVTGAVGDIFLQISAN